MRRFTSFATATAIVLTSVAAAPAEARGRYHGGWGYRDRDHISTGEVIGGLLILGTIAAIASSASKDKAERRNDRYDPPYREPQQDAPALLRRHVAPRAVVERAPRRRHRGVHVRGVPLRHRGDRLLRRRVDHVERGGRVRRDEPAVDVVGVGHGVGLGVGRWRGDGPSRSVGSDRRTHECTWMYTSVHAHHTSMVCTLV